MPGRSLILRVSLVTVGAVAATALIVGVSGHGSQPDDQSAGSMKSGAAGPSAPTVTGSAGPLGATVARDEARVVRATLNGESARIALPAEGKPKGLAIWFHGQGGSVDSKAENPFLVSLYDDGWAVATSSYHSASWGNAASTDDTRRLIEWAQQQSGIPATLWVSGSMGGAVSLNAMNFGVNPPACWYGVHPAISLDHMSTVPGAPGYIHSAYQGKPPLGRDPVHNVARLPADVDYRVIGSQEDPLVRFGQNVAPLVRGLRDRGVDVSLRIATGGHVNASHWNSEDLLTFANSCLDR